MTASYQAYVGGRWIDADRRLEVRNPADWRRVIGTVPALSADTVTSGMAHAAAHGAEWRRTIALDRAQVLTRVAGLIRSEAEHLAHIVSEENGKTVAEARVEVTKASDFFEYYASMARQPYGELLHDGRAHVTTTVRHEAVGLVLAITPWNDPLLTPARKLAPALAFGNTVVLKPASDTPIIALELTRLLLEAGLSSDAITTVTGRASEIGEALTTSEHIGAITFTGSTDVGLELHRAVAGRNIRVQCEMGGKNTAIVLADADLDHAAEVISAAAFAQGGQRCTATSRVIVAGEVKEELVLRLVALADGLKVGAGEVNTTDVGPLVNPSHRDEVVASVEKARKAGATVRAGGEALVNRSKGCFVRPTVLEVSTEMDIWTDEVFGPVVAVLGCEDLDQALDLANDSTYGLAAALYTRSLVAAQHFIEEIEAGQVAVNLPTSGWDVHHPFGGFKLSGSPFKEQGSEARGFYTRVKTCAVLGL